MEIFKSSVIRGGNLITPDIIEIDHSYLVFKKGTILFGSKKQRIPLKSVIGVTVHSGVLAWTNDIEVQLGSGSIFFNNFTKKDAIRIEELLVGNNLREGDQNPIVDLDYTVFSNQIFRGSRGKYWNLQGDPVFRSNELFIEMTYTLLSGNYNSEFVLGLRPINDKKPTLGFAIVGNGRVAITEAHYYPEQYVNYLLDPKSISQLNTGLERRNTISIEKLASSFVFKINHDIIYRTQSIDLSDFEVTWYLIDETMTLRVANFMAISI